MIPQVSQPGNGGFFGSMLSGNGGAGGASSFTSPPMSPDILAMLAKLGTGAGNAAAGMGGAGPTGLPPNSFSPFMGGAQQPQGQPGGGAAAAAPGGGPAGGAAGGPNIAQLLQSLSPDQLKAIMARLGGGAPAPAAMPGR